MTQKEIKHQNELLNNFLEETLIKDIQAHQYDFKYLMKEYYCYYSPSKYGTMRERWLKEEPDIDPAEKDPMDVPPAENDPIKLWYTYKKLDKTFKGRRFDCDSWNGTSDLTDKIYDVLWRDREDNWGLSDMRKRFGGDTMNSFAYTFNALSGEKDYTSSFHAYIESKKQDDHKFDVLQDYAKWTGCVGNFVLVPDGYNGCRGKSKKLRDYWDLSLHDLRTNGDGHDWLGNAGISFNRFINTFFLWDYVDERYDVLPLFPSHNVLLDRGCEEVFPRIYDQEHVDEFKIFTNNVNHCIRRRGKFMVAMLRIATLEKSDDYDVIVDVLATDERFNSMEAVVEKLIHLESEKKISKEAVAVLRKLNLSDPV